METESIILNIEQDSPDVFADPLFEKVFYHLFTYSYKYGEKVTRIEISFSYSTTELIITVADNGIGISPENKIHLFEWRSGNERTLGLFLAQKILARTGITIRETGEFKKGTRLKLLFRWTGSNRIKAPILKIWRHEGIFLTFAPFFHLMGLIFLPKCKG